MNNIEERLINLEILYTNQEKTINELNDECVRMSKIIDILVKQNKMLMEFLKESPVKPLSEETPPPHY
ncbi:MAG: SlyX family protein [Alphaproteobacteria bacterium]|nr:SlyX family protein [Alphaproteobacteria bacterium]